MFDELVPVLGHIWLCALYFERFCRTKSEQVLDVNIVISKCYIISKNAKAAEHRTQYFEEIQNFQRKMCGKRWKRYMQF